MAFISGADRHQTLLLPETLDDYVTQDHPVRFVEEFVEGLDLEKSGFARVTPAAIGRPGYRPADLIKLYVWGYLNRVRSSRRLECECGRNLELIWLLRKLTPDFKTISDFRKDNADAFKSVFREFGLLCRELGLWGKELVAIDGTRLKAVNSIDRNHTRGELQAWLQRLDAKVEEFLKQLEQNDSSDGNAESEAADTIADTGATKAKLEELKERRQEVQEWIAQLDESGAKEISRTDPDSRRMQKVGVGYNGQIAVDSLHHLIVEAEVINSKNDCNEMVGMVEATCEAMGVDLKAESGSAPKFTLDRGYHDRQQVAQAEEIGAEIYVPSPKRGHAATRGVFHKSEFKHHAQGDYYLCPGGKQLDKQSKTIKNGVLTAVYANPAACKQCALKAQCTKRSYRCIDRWEKEAYEETVAARTAAHPEIVRKRSTLVEHPFGTIKFWRDQRAFLTRGIEMVRAEFRLSTLAYNITRVIAVMGVGPLLQALKMRRQKAMTGVFTATCALKTGLSMCCEAVRRAICTQIGEVGALRPLLSHFLTN